MASELVIEACASVSTVCLDEPLDGGAVLQEAGGSTGIALVPRGGDLHAACIGAARRSGNPWRE
ncbi:MAG TPA: hypothetical protein VJX91_03910 [Candidatus Eisenbacteria bacterium]|nr:hypothetical protein [Candidatus Eisenbacteria bacterium]